MPLWIGLALVFWLVSSVADVIAEHWILAAVAAAAAFSVARFFRRERRRAAQEEILRREQEEGHRRALYLEQERAGADYIADQCRDLIATFHQVAQRRLAVVDEYGDADLDGVKREVRRVLKKWPRGRTRRST